MCVLIHILFRLKCWLECWSKALNSVNVYFFRFFPSNNKLRIIYCDLWTRKQKQNIKEQTTHKITIHLDLFLYVFFNIDRIVFWIFFYQALCLSSSDKFTLKRKLFLYTPLSSSIFDLKAVNGFFISYCSSALCDLEIGLGLSVKI